MPEPLLSPLSKVAPLPETEPRRSLVFDIENKPGTYGGNDYTHPKVTALACQFLEEPSITGWCFNRRDVKKCRKAMLEFTDIWDSADVVVGHNIRRHDVRILRGFCVSLDLPPLSRKLAVDTYLDQTRVVGLSRSLENLAARWECPIQKLSLSEYDWERAYDGEGEGIDIMFERVVSDVEINVWLYHELVRRGLLSTIGKPV